MHDPVRHLPPVPRDAARLELEHHIAELVDRLIGEGMDAATAASEAERRFGDAARYRARLERSVRRRATTRRWLGFASLLADAAVAAARTVRRRPGFAAAVVLTLGLGIGANAAMFGILDRLLFQPPQHVRDPDRVRRVVVERPFQNGRDRVGALSYPDVLDLKEVPAFAAVAALGVGAVEETVGHGATAQRVLVATASWNFFPLIGVQPILGRFYGQDDDRVGAAPTAVVSEEYWRRSLGGDRGALGRTLSLRGAEFQVVGVAPAGFTGVDLGRVDVWLPLETSRGLTGGAGWRDNRYAYSSRAVVRLADDAELASAEATATARHLVGRAESIAQGRYAKDARLWLEPLVQTEGRDVRPEFQVSWWLGGVSVLVLLIACANVANLLLAHATRRRREIAVRLALGIGRSRLVAESVLESVLLAVVGGGFALLLAAWGGLAMRSVWLPDVYFPEGSVSTRMVAFTFAAAVVAGIVSGLGPGLRASRRDVAAELAGGGGMSARRSRVRRALTVAQAATSVVLLVGAGLFLRSLSRVQAQAFGFDIDRLLSVSLEFENGLLPTASLGGPPSTADTELKNQLYARAADRLAGLPSVERVAATDNPFGWISWGELAVPGRDSMPSLPPIFRDIAPGYLATLGLDLVRGRDFTSSDDAAAPRVALVSESMARTLWPEGDALGQTLLVEQAHEPFTVVGVVRDDAHAYVRENLFLTYYLPIAQRPAARMNGLYVRAREGETAAVAAAAAPILRSLDPRIRYATVQPLRDFIDPQARSWRLGATMFSAFGLLALLVAAVGLYSVLAFDVAQRTREIGIRNALGADRRRLLAAVVGDGLAMAGSGVALGLVAAMAAAPWVRDLLFQVSPRDPGVLVLVAGAMVATALVASLAPAVRATRVDPVRALRSE